MKAKTSDLDDQLEYVYITVKNKRQNSKNWNKGFF